MRAFFRSCLFPFFLLSIFASASAQSCRSYSFANNAQYATCLDLPYLNSFLHWTYDQSTGALQIAFRRTGTSSSTWVAWALNLQGQGMTGAQSLVAYQNSTGTRAYTTPISDHSPTMAEANLSFNVSGLTGRYENNEMSIFATLQLDSGVTTVNHIWQEGPLSGGAPSAHATNAANLGAQGSLNLLTGVGVTTGDSRIKKRNVHGVLNAVSWGTLMPMGAIIARYLKVFKSADPAWFYLHVACQSSAYAVGVAGWGTGLKLGSDSPGTEQTTHRNIGITLFVLGTLQVFALLLRPNKDNKYRLYWNIYHHSIGYIVIILSIINIYEGFEALGSQKNWKKAYTAIIIVLGCIAVCLEAFTWFIVLKRKRAASDKFPPTAFAANGHSARSQQTA